jgi:hypothetical protein
VYIKDHATRSLGAHTKFEARLILREQVIFGRTHTFFFSKCVEATSSSCGTLVFPLMLLELFLNEVPDA